MPPILLSSLNKLYNGFFRSYSQNFSNEFFLIERVQRLKYSRTIKRLAFKRANNYPKHQLSKYFEFLTEESDTFDHVKIENMFVQYFFPQSLSNTRKLVIHEVVKEFLSKVVEVIVSLEGEKICTQQKQQQKQISFFHRQLNNFLQLLDKNMTKQKQVEQANEQIYKLIQELGLNRLNNKKSDKKSIDDSNQDDGNSGQNNLLEFVSIQDLQKVIMITLIYYRMDLLTRTIKWGNTCINMLDKLIKLKQDQNKQIAYLLSTRLLIKTIELTIYARRNKKELLQQIQQQLFVIVKSLFNSIKKDNKYSCRQLGFKQQQQQQQLVCLFYKALAHVNYHCGFKQQTLKMFQNLKEHLMNIGVNVVNNNDYDNNKCSTQNIHIVPNITSFRSTYFRMKLSSSIKYLKQPKAFDEQNNPIFYSLQWLKNQISPLIQQQTQKHSQPIIINVTRSSPSQPELNLNHVLLLEEVMNCAFCIMNNKQFIKAIQLLFYVLSQMRTYSFINKQLMFQIYQQVILEGSNFQVIVKNIQELKKYLLRQKLIQIDDQQDIQIYDQQDFNHNFQQKQTINPQQQISQQQLNLKQKTSTIISKCIFALAMLYNKLKKYSHAFIFLNLLLKFNKSQQKFITEYFTFDKKLPTLCQRRFSSFIVISGKQIDLKFPQQSTTQLIQQFVYKSHVVMVGQMNSKRNYKMAEFFDYYDDLKVWKEVNNWQILQKLFENVKFVQKMLKKYEIDTIIIQNKQKLQKKCHQKLTNKAAKWVDNFLSVSQRVDFLDKQRNHPILNGQISKTSNFRSIDMIEKIMQKKKSLIKLNQKKRQQKFKHKQNIVQQMMIQITNIAQQSQIFPSPITQQKKFQFDVRKNKNLFSSDFTKKQKIMQNKFNQIDRRLKSKNLKQELFYDYV